MNDFPREHPDFIDSPRTPGSGSAEGHPWSAQSEAGRGSFDKLRTRAEPRMQAEPPAQGESRIPEGTRLSETTRLPTGSRTPEWPTTPDRTGGQAPEHGTAPGPPASYAAPAPEGPSHAAPQSRPTPPTQQSLPGNPFRTAAPVRNPDQRAGYGDGRAFEKRASRRGALAGVLAVALLSAGLGGVAGVTATNYVGSGQQNAISSPTTDAAAPQEDSSTNSTTVVQADPVNPDWEVTAEAVSPAVVAIQVRSAQGAGAGSGVIIDTDGTIVTNNHVIAGGEISVVVADRVYEADVVGTDPSTDLAVIRLVTPPPELSTLEFGNYQDLRVGQPVMAVGNPLGLSDTVTTGIISALNRPVTTEEITEGDTSNGTVVTAAIQTSAAINPGNSGGALVDGSGRLVGITSSIAAMPGSGGSSGNIGIGFAIPVNQVENIVGQLLTDGTVTHAQLGVSARDAAVDGLLGAQVAEVVAGSAAADGGLQEGDVITKVDGVTIANAEALVAMIRNAAVGQSVTINYVRGAADNSVEVTLGAAQ